MICLFISCCCSDDIVYWIARNSWNSGKMTSNKTVVIEDYILSHQLHSFIWHCLYIIKEMKLQHCLDTGWTAKNWTEVFSFQWTFYFRGQHLGYFIGRLYLMSCLDSVLRINYFTEQLHHPPWTKWPLFRRRYIQMHFCEWKVWYFD